MWITNAPVADVAVVWARTDDGHRAASWCRRTRPAFSAREVTHKMSLRASVTGEIILDERAAAGRRACCPGRAACAAPLSCLTEARFGIVWGALGAARDCLDTAIDYAAHRGAVRQADRRLPAHPGQARRHGAGAAEGLPAGAAPRPAGRRRHGCTPEQVSVGKLNNVREAHRRSPGPCRTILGANGISGEYPVMRHANNLESVLTYEGTSEVHTLVIGQALTGISAFR